jgi:hypothetical protein
MLKVSILVYIMLHGGGSTGYLKLFKGTVSPDYKCLEVILIKSPLLGHVTPDI